MKIEIITQVKSTIEINTPCYFKDGCESCPTYYKIPVEGRVIAITKYKDGSFNLTFSSNADQIITYEKITAEKFYELAEEMVRYINNL